jgi:hypothetical protein
MSSPLAKIINPWYPPTAVGLEKGMASIVHLEHGRAGFALRRAATITLSDALIRPSFDQPNISDPSELAAALSELATSAGLLRQRRWSITLPGAATRSLILTMESKPASGRELEEVLRWKMERGFGVPVDELSISRDRLPKDPQGRDRYIVTAVRASALAEYEDVFTLLRWRSGLILPRHLGEAQWLTKNGFAEDSLLLSAHEEGFTAGVFRGKQPLILRLVVCEAKERDDEFYRLLLFYRDRRSSEAEGESQVISRLLVLGSGFDRSRASEIVNETLGVRLRALDAGDVGLLLPTSDLSFDAIAAPAGLATLSWQ